MGIEPLGCRVRGKEENIHPTIVGKPGRFEILYPCFRRLIGIPSLQFNNGGFVELVPLAMRRCVYLFRGDALGNQEIFDTLSAKVRQALIIFTRATLISKGAEREFRVGVVLKILFESTGKGCERSLLTAYKPECWVLLCGVVGWKEDAVEQDSGNWLDGTLQAYRHRFSVRAATHVGCSHRVFKFFVDRALGCFSCADGHAPAASAVNGPERDKRSTLRVPLSAS